MKYSVPERKFRQRFLVKRADKLISISTDRIACFYARNRVNFIRTTDNKNYIIDETMEQLEHCLNEEEFFRINRSYIISYKSIIEVNIYFNSRLKIRLHTGDEEEIFVSKERVADFKKWIGGN